MAHQTVCDWWLLWTNFWAKVLRNEPNVAWDYTTILCSSVRNVLIMASTSEQSIPTNKVTIVRHPPVLVPGMSVVTTVLGTLNVGTLNAVTSVTDADINNHKCISVSTRSITVVLPHTLVPCLGFWQADKILLWLIVAFVCSFWLVWWSQTHVYQWHVWAQL